MRAFVTDPTTLTRFVSAVETSIHTVYPGVPVFPSMSSGTSDSMWFRHVGVPSYGASAVFSKGSEDSSHRLNKRGPVSNIRPAIPYSISLVPTSQQKDGVPYGSYDQ